MSNSRLLEPIDADSDTLEREALTVQAGIGAVGATLSPDTVGAESHLERLTQKLPRLHFFRGTFKLFGQSMNACFAGLFAVELALLTLVFNVLIAGGSVVLAVGFASVNTFCMICMGLYDARQRETPFGILFRLLAALSISLVILEVGSRVFAVGQISGYQILNASCWSFLFLCALRYFFHTFVDGRVLRRRILVLGTGKRARFVEGLRRKSDQRGFELVGFITSNTCQHCYVTSDKLLSVNGSICEFALENEVDEIVIALDDRRAGLPTDDLLDCRMSGIKVTNELDFFEREASLIQLDVIRPGWLIHAKGFNANALRDFEKRCFDIFGASLLLILLSPFMLLAAIAILIECGMGSPVIYSQVRVGRGGKSFTLFKFRSMRVDAEADGKAQWAAKSDPRITRVGNVLRKCRIDEIPQLWNVLRGDMSLVGPRPERPQFVDELTQINSFYPERHRVAPGLTGWAQLCYPYGASERDSMQKLKFDLYYIKNHSVLFDFYILAQTAEVVLFQRGSR